MPAKILVMEDSQTILELEKEMLESAGFQVISAGDGEEAVKKAKDEKPDLIILDVMVPKLNGLQVCRLLKFDKNMKNVPIIMFTTLNNKDDREWGQKVGADLYLTKPIKPTEFLTAVKDLLLKKQA